jgi:catechol 2,3-dioxygenase-like lactoylglutathione lyase family enzyme
MKARILILGLVVSAFTAGMWPGVQAQGSAAAPAQATTPQPAVPLSGIAQVTFKTSDMAKARAYYQGVLGLAEAFTVKDPAGVTSAYFKVNDDQFIEITPTLQPDDLIREARVVFESFDLKKLHAIYTERGLNPSPITTGPDGNPVFRVKDPGGNNLDFLQYVPGSKQSLARGKFLSPDRISTLIWHVGIMSKDRGSATPFYRDKLGFENGRNVPGRRNEYVELPSSDRNLETKDPPLDPNNPATKDQYTREVYGAVYHVSLEVPDARVARDLLQQRGKYDDVRVRATVGNNRHWLIHMFDPDGTRAEIMETGLQTELPAGTIMAPGPPAPPILPPPGAGRGRGGRGAAADRGGEAPAQPSSSPGNAGQSGRGPATASPQAGRGGGRGGRYVDAEPMNYSDHAGWTRMFDGATLDGWDGPNDLWHVENGNIVVRSKADPPTGSTYLLWKGGEPKDFELLLEVKLDGEGANSGVQFRSTLLGEVPGNPRSKWETRGYQADLDNRNSNTGSLIECCAGPRRGVPPRPDRAFRGQVVRTATATGEKPTLVGTVGDPDALKSFWKPGEWNQIHLIARGRTMTYFINGQLMSVLIDVHPTMFVDHGVISIQLEGRGDNTASFRNLWLKNLQ